MADSLELFQPPEEMGLGCTEASRTVATGQRRSQRGCAAAASVLDISPAPQHGRAVGVPAAAGCSVAPAPGQVSG